MKKKITSSKTILNKRARFDYELSETLIAGIALSGPETKSLRLGQLIEAKKSGKNIIPIKLLTSSRYIKVEIGVGRGKKKYDKREIIKKRDLERSARHGE